MRRSILDIADAGIIAVVRATDAADALGAISALVRGGITCIEVTNTITDAAQVIRETRDRWPDEVIVGAGTITEAAQVADAVAAGAEFLVAPGMRASLTNEMTSTGRPVLVGALTPSEIMSAIDHGADAVKLFPASLGGAAYLRALRGPFPKVRWVPTGGVTLENLHAWVEAGAHALGIGGELCEHSAIREARWDRIERRAQEFREVLLSARAGVSA